MELGFEEARVVGSLVEKQLATPQQYPLSLHALVAACNQASGRDPVVAFDESTVLRALDRLKDQRLVRFVHPSHGRSVLRYRQVLEEVLGLDDRGLALVALLLLRGPQTPGELRARSDRLAEFASLAEVEAELAALAGRDPALVTRLARRPGQKEERFTCLLVAPSAGAPEGHPGPAGAPGPPGPPGPPATRGSVGSPWPAGAVGHPSPTGEMAPRSLTGALGADTAGPWAGGDEAGVRDELDVLRGEIEGLRAEVASLRGALDDLRASLGG